MATALGLAVQVVSVGTTPLYGVGVIVATVGWVLFLVAGLVWLVLALSRPAVRRPGHQPHRYRQTVNRPIHPRHTEGLVESSWERGARGERVVADVVDRAGLLALHDRSRPGTQANIDHIVIGPAAVYVVDAKNYNSGRLWAGEHALRIGDRDETGLLRGVRGQAARVRAALKGAGLVVDVVPVLCFTGSSTPRRRTLTQGVHLVAPDTLPHLLRSPGPLTDPSGALKVADVFAWHFPPA